MTEPDVPAGKVPKKRPQPKGGSRKGCPNKNTALIRDMIANALNDAGGEAYLAAKAESHPAAFLALIGKVMPVQVEGTDGPALKFAEIRLVAG